MVSYEKRLWYVVRNLPYQFYRTFPEAKTVKFDAANYSDDRFNKTVLECREYHDLRLQGKTIAFGEKAQAREFPHMVSNYVKLIS